MSEQGGDVLINFPARARWEDVEGVQHWVAYQCNRRLPDGEWHAGNPLGATDDLFDAFRLCGAHAQRHWEAATLSFDAGGGACGIVSYQAALPVQSETVERPPEIADRWPREALYARRVSVEIRYVVEGF